MTRRSRELLTSRSVGSFGIALAVAVAVGLVLAPAAARAQFAEYTPPGTTAERPGDDKARLEGEMEEALWQAGAFRINPWIGVTNASLVSNAYTTGTDQPQDTDVTMTLGAGITGVVPFGQKVFVRFEAIPQYVFWLEQDERNNFNEWYGARLYGFYNRLYLEAGAQRRDQVTVRSSEFDQETNTRRDTIEAIAELRLGGAFHLFAGAGLHDISTLEEETDERLSFFSSQDREETVLRGGFRYRPRDNVLFGVGIEDAEADFADEARDRSNTGTSPFVEVSWDAAKFFLMGDVVFRDHEPEGETSQFTELSEATGNLQLTFNPGWRMTYSPYARRDVSYAQDESYSHFLRDRFGFRVGAILSDRWDAGAFVETGVDDYQGITVDSPVREDDISSWGVDLSFKISERFSLGVGYSLNEYDSNLDEFDRDNGRLMLQIGVSDLVAGGR